VRHDVDDGPGLINRWVSYEIGGFIMVLMSKLWLES